MTISNFFNDHLKLLVRQLVAGQVDYLEAGDIRTPGLAAALRASASGDAAKPLAIDQASRHAPLTQMTTYTLDEGLALLSARVAELAHTPVGPAARVFTVKLRKAP